MDEYAGISEATADVRAKFQDSDHLTHPLATPALRVVVPVWTEALSNFAACSTVTRREEASLEQIRSIYYNQESWLEKSATQHSVGTLNEHDPGKVLFMGLVRDLQIRFASKENLNPHKLAVLLDERYTVE